MSNEQTLAFEDRKIKNSNFQQSNNTSGGARSLPNQDYMTSANPSSYTKPMAAQTINKQQVSRVTAQPAGGKKPQAKMSKEEAKSLASSMKQIALAASIIAFVMFGGLIAPQIEAVASQSSTTQNATSTSTATQTPAASSGSFFNQSQAGGYSIGSSSSDSSSTSSSNTTTTAGTGTHVS